jgi:hypothetical protein
VARRPDIRQRDVRDQAQQNSEVMSTEELKQMRGSLSRISLNAARHAYHTAYARCRMVNDRVPSARSIQELVQVWKQLWKRR